MNYKNITVILIGTTILVLGCWDILAYARGGGGATISETIWGWSKNYPCVPFAFGILMGHLFTVPNTMKTD